MFVWPPSFALARAMSISSSDRRGWSAEVIASTRTALTAAERRSGALRKTALTEIATKLKAAPAGADAAKVNLLTTAVTDLANAPR